LAERGTSRVLEENLSALAVRQPSLADSIRRAAADPRFVFSTARNGLIVPGIRSDGGTVPFHSLYDPRRESARFAESFRGAGCIIVGGLGAGYHVSALLQHTGASVVVVVEKNAGVLKSLLEHVPLSDLLRDPRLLVAAGVDTIRDAILSSWHPAVMGGLRSAPLRTWCDQEREFFDAAEAETLAAIEAVRVDFSVQSHFGKRWFANIIMNLAGAATRPGAFPHGDDAIVTAAGPSLDLHLGQLAAERGGRMLVATDTSLPALLRSGIIPDAVLSIDCQNHGYHHFLQGKPPGIALFLDLASPPLLSRQLSFPVFVAGSHPFERYIDSHWLRLPRIDMSGGNVTHAAVSLARFLGARRVTVYGADFCYPDGKAYARGTYLYDYFWSDQSRVSPAEARFFAFVCGSSAGPARREVRAGKSLYMTPVLNGYRDRFLGLMQSIDAEVIPVPGAGQELPRGTVRPRAPAPDGAEAGPKPSDAPRSTWREFLSVYFRSIELLPAFSAVSPAPERELWNTLLPAAARIVKEGHPPGPGALEEARLWSLERLTRVVRSPDDDLQG
jgi:hypothetical protein